MSFSSPEMTAYPMEQRPLQSRPSLAPQQLGLAAVDAGHCCAEHTQLHLHLENPNVQQDAVRVDDNATGQPVLFVMRRAMSLHAHRSIVNASGVCVATLRLTRIWRRRALETTYCVYLGADTNKKTAKAVFEFTIRKGWGLDAEFEDLMTGAKCHLGCDGHPGDFQFWVKHGSKDADRHPIAQMHTGLPGSLPGHTIEVAEGVDVLLVLLVCLALNESGKPN
jgi:hypothetical protein